MPATTHRNDSIDRSMFVDWILQILNGNNQPSVHCKQSSQTICYSFKHTQNILYRLLTSICWDV